MPQQKKSRTPDRRLQWPGEAMEEYAETLGATTHQLLMDQLDFGQAPSKVLKNLERLPANMALLVSAQHFADELTNGGVDQFFLNSSGVIAPEAVKGLKLLGLGDAAKILQGAIKAFGREYPRAFRPRNAAMNRLAEEREADFMKVFDDETDELYALLDDASATVGEAYDEYLKKHAKKIFVGAPKDG